MTYKELFEGVCRSTVLYIPQASHWDVIDDDIRD